MLDLALSIIVYVSVHCILGLLFSIVKFENFN